MSVQEMATGTGNSAEQEPRRVVEAEFKLPRMEKITLPHVDTRPLRHAAEETLLVGIGAGVLLARGLGKAVAAAREAGRGATEHPGPVTRTLLNLVRGAQPPATGAIVRHVPVLPIADYDALSDVEIGLRLPDLDQAELQLLRDYEAAHAARAAILGAIDARLAAE